MPEVVIKCKECGVKFSEWRVDRERLHSRCLGCRELREHEQMVERVARHREKQRGKIEVEPRRSRPYSERWVTEADYPPSGSNAADNAVTARSPV